MIGTHTRGSRDILAPAPIETSARRAWPVVTAAVVTAAALGPYTPVAGLRLEQVAVYGTVAVLALPMVPRRQWVSRHAGIVMSALAVVLLVATLGGVFPPFDPSMMPAGQLIAGLDNLTMPIAAIALTQMWLVYGDRAALLRAALATLIVGMSANAIVATISTGTDLTPLLSHWWASSDAQFVALRAAALGRYSGILNQPAEAGLLYGIALVGTVYLLRSRPLLLCLAASLITLGGALCVSKIFLLVALPVAMLQAIGGGWRPVLALAGTAGAAMLTVTSGVFNTWAGSSYLTRLLHPEGDPFSYYSGERIGSDQLEAMAAGVWAASRLAGVGIGGLAAPTDSAWMQMLVMCGAIGVAAYLLVNLTLAHGAWARRQDDWPVVALGMALVVLAVAASVGLPALSANRGGSVLCIALGLTVLARPNGSTMAIATK